MGDDRVEGLLLFRGDRERLNGDRRSNHIGLVCLDVIPSPSQIYVLPVQGRTPTATGVWCVSRHLVGSIHFHLTEHPLPSKTDNLSLTYKSRVEPKEKSRRGRVSKT